MKKIVYFLLLIITLLYLPDICYLTGNTPRFIGITYTVYYMMKTVLAAIGILWLFKELLNDLNK